MKEAKLDRRVVYRKTIAVTIAIMIVASSVTVLRFMVNEISENERESSFDIQSFPSRPFVVKTVLSQAGPWVSFDSEAPGTPAEANMIISDTTGITIVADFHGFWRSNYSINSIQYYDFDMPGTGTIHEPGKPMLPILTELVEIPHDIDVSVEVLATSNATARGYNIRPAPPLYFPVGKWQDSSNATLQNTTIPSSFLGPEYNQNAVFPGVRANITGGTGAEPIIMRGHRILELSFCPVQYNPMRGVVMLFSQIVIRLKYSSPTQIRPIPESLRSEMFERILKGSVLHYDSSHIIPPPLPGHPTSYVRSELPPSMPNATVPQFFQSSIDIQSSKEPGAEYLIITTDYFKNQAQRLAEWKERKGTPSRVETISDDISSDAKIINVKGIIERAYNNWNPAPTYVLLFGDVEAIPTNYVTPHIGADSDGLYFDKGFFGSDLHYFILQGYDFLPDIIYGRISVDTEEQAKIFVDKILRYEQSPPDEEMFYKNMLTAGYFEDKTGPDGVKDGQEDSGGPFIYHLERIRQYLENLEHEYTVHYNYSCPANHLPLPEYLHAPIGEGSQEVEAYVGENYEWLLSYANQQDRYDAHANITANINDGRFLVMYYSHGGSKNMIYPFIWPGTTDNRDYTEGWHSPFFNTSYFSLLQNEHKTPLILSIACSTGWFDGETDQDFLELYRSDGQDFDGNNAFALIDNECFAEDITRLEEGGAIAVIAPSRQIPARLSGDLLDGIIQSFWPGFLESEPQPIYEMGGALYNGRLHAAGDWLDTWSRRDIARMMFEGFHLFGDPETQLWTDRPSKFNVSYPESIGTHGQQKFVVTVRDNITDQPVRNAKICVQQNPDIYLVGYSDSNGQVIFDVEPQDRSWSLNVTVTKHNYVPHIGEIAVLESTEATIIVTSHWDLGNVYSSVDITISGFAESHGVQIYFNDASVETMYQSQPSVTETVGIPEGSAEYITVRAVQEDTGLVATGRFYRLSSDQNPDPFIYSHKDPSTWYLADDTSKPVWDNPCITIYDGTTPADHLEQGITYDVNVTVHNRGSGDAIDAAVTLWYATFGGGLLWENPQTITVTIPLGESVEVGPFEWEPLFPNTVSLYVTIFQENETEEDKINNEGAECWNVFPVCSPGESTFEVGNPSDDPEYVTINVKQEGDHEDVWSASVQDYSSESLEPDNSYEPTLVVEPPCDLEPNDGRTFTAEISINDEMILGLEFNGYCPVFSRLVFVGIFLVVFLIVMVVICYYAMRGKQGEQPA